MLVMENSNKKDISISIIRVCAMLAIVLAHILTYFSINTHQILSIGVEIFLIISGYLYSNRKIENKKEFLIKRAKKLLIPFIIWSFILSISTIVIYGKNKLAIQSFITSLFNLQGLNWIFLNTKIGINRISGIAHCWFLTVIFICYILMALIKNTELENKLKNKKYLILLIIAQIVLSYLKIQISYLICFYIGYSFIEKDKIDRKQARNIIVFAVIISITRITANLLIDGTILYNDVIARLSSLVIGYIFVIFVMYNEINANNFYKAISNNVVFNFFEEYSFYIYIVHYCFMKDPFNVNSITSNRTIQLSYILLMTFLSCIILKKVSNKITK